MRCNHCHYSLWTCTTELGPNIQLHGYEIYVERGLEYTLVRNIFHSPSVVNSTETYVTHSTNHSI